MSDSNATHSSEDPGLIKTPTQLIVVVVLAFVVPIAAIFTIIHFVMGDSKSRATPGMSDKAVAERIKPVGSVPDVEKGPAYPGSKDYVVASGLLDDPDLCIRALRAVVADAPPPKPKKPKIQKVK